VIACYYRVGDHETEFWSDTNISADGYWIGWRNTASTYDTRRVGHWTLPALPPTPDDPPNFAAPKILPRRQSDKAPCFTLSQMGYWLNQCGRRVA
jgi:hypothetical protein